MLRRKGLAALAIGAALACAGIVQAADTAVPLSDQVAPVLLDDVSPPAAKPLTTLIDKTPLGKPMADLGISAGGFIEGSWTFDANHPSGGGISGRALDIQEQSILLDQLDLTVSRAVDPTKLDFGFMIEQIYGADAALIHSNGLTTQSPSKIGAARQPKNQYDLTQAYITVGVPVGKGLTVTIGKFVTPLGYEVINPTGNPLFSHSMLFTQLPFTQTGVTASYKLTDSISVMGGFTRGWDQALEDVNGDLDLLGQLVWTHDKCASIINISSGNQHPSGTPINGWRTVIDYVGTYQYSDELKLGVNVDYAWEAQVDNGSTGQWYGADLYASYTLSSMFTLNARAEWFDDQDGAAPASFNAGTPNTYYGLTLGVAIHPVPNNEILSNLVIRPEVRLDYADKPTWGGDNTHDQLTMALEGYFTF